MKFNHIKLFFALFAFTVSSSQLFAHFGSKGPYGGHVSSGIAYDTLVYLGTNDGGVYFSTNSKLVSWSAKPVGLKSGKITALAHTGKYLFAATADSGIFIYTGFIGSDRYWNKINTGLTNLHITSLVAIDTSTVMAGTDGGGIFITKNKGASWTAVNNTVLHHLKITGLVKAGKRIIHTSFDGGLYASDDNGVSWIDFNDAQTEDIDSTIAVSYNAANDQLMVVNTGGLYLGASINTTAAPAYALAETGLPSGSKVISISNNGSNWYLVTSKGIFTSSTGTISWAPINNGLTTQQVSVVIPFRTSLIAGSKNDGIFKSPNPFTTWARLNTGFNNLKTYSMVLSGAGIIATSTEKGVFVSKDLAASYQVANKGLTDSLHVNDIIFADKYLVAATQNNGLYFSADTGRSWLAFVTGIPETNVSKLFYSNNKVYSLTATGKLYETSLTTSSVTAIQYDLPVNTIPGSIAFYGNKLLLSTNNGIFVKTIEGTSWAAQNDGLQNKNVTSVTTNGPKLFAGTAGSGVFVSDTAAVSWSATAPTSIEFTGTMGLNGDYIQAMAYNAGYVFASYKGGLLASSDNGTNWIAAGTQFNLPSFTDVNKIGFSNGTASRVFVTTSNNGLYSNALSELPLITGIDDATLTSDGTVSIYPNPGNGNFNISLSDVSASIRSVIIYDFTGKELASFTGNHQQYQTCYAPGLYLVKIFTSKNEYSVQKLMIK